MIVVCVEVADVAEEVVVAVIVVGVVIVV